MFFFLLDFIFFPFLFFLFFPKYYEIKRIKQPNQKIYTHKHDKGFGNGLWQGRDYKAAER